MEKDLFLPIKEYFENFGYVCDGEVDSIDLYMQKNNTDVAVELKLSLDFKALQQAALRQKIVDTVFIGIPRPKNISSRAFKDKLYLCKRLGIGVIMVSPRTQSVEIISEPVVSELSSFQIRNAGQKNVLLSEFQKRKVKNNIGGVKNTKLMTAYREDALLVLDALSELGGTAKGSEVKKLSGIDRATNIMRDNYYGWFEKKDTGIYSLRDEGYAAFEEFEEAMKKLKQQ